MVALCAANPDIRSVRGRQDLAFQERARRALAPDSPALEIPASVWVELGRLAVARGNDAAREAARILLTRRYRSGKACAYLRDLRRDPTQPAPVADVDSLMVVLRRAIVTYQDRHGKVSAAIADAACTQLTAEVRAARRATA
jgi:hypothetical protein